jgi:MerR family transcriptional regulator/heat shock protein HspR
MADGIDRPATRGEVVSRDARARAVYIISVAAELAGVHPQTFRIYERKGLVQPQRTQGNTRRYSEDDIDRLRAIQSLTEAGVNLAGAKRIIELEAEVDRLLATIEELRTDLERRRPIPMSGRRVGAAIVPLRAVAPFPWEGVRG